MVSDAIPPRPWQVSAPPWMPGAAYIMDAAGVQVFPSAIDRDLAEHVVSAVNAWEAPA